MEKNKGKKKIIENNQVKSSVIPSPDSQLENIISQDKSEKLENEQHTTTPKKEDMPVWLL